MKELVIEIPDETYEQIEETHSIGGMMSDTIVNIILNGTPIERYCDHCSGTVPFVDMVEAYLFKEY